ncbi:hypothetical protein ACOKM3_27080 [Streptomyces sp. BH106]|uniref:hypothetical protein n=1 Tax=Streptomyces sp. BH106 TaxID=3410409 RepID=UPI003CFA7053
MPSTRTMWCETCERDEPHRQLSRSEQQQLRADGGVKNPGSFWTCTGNGGTCRTLRTGFNKSPFDGPHKLR